MKEVIILLCCVTLFLLMAVCAESLKKFKAKESARARRPSEILGRATWDYLHTMVETIPSHPSFTDFGEVADHIAGIARFYPCDSCRRHFTQYLEAHPIPRTTKLGVVRWVFDFHNAVNCRLGKPQKDWLLYAKEKYDATPATIMQCLGCTDDTLPTYTESTTIQ